MGISIIALLVWPIFYLLAYLFFRSLPRKAKIMSFSDLGSSKKEGNQFDLLLIIVGIFQTVFLYSFWGRFNSAIAFLLLTSVFGVLAGVVRQKGHIGLHKTISALGFLFSAPGWIILGLNLFSMNKLFGTLLFVWGIVILPALAFAIWKRSKLIILCEAFFFLGAFLTNIALLVTR